jgi:adenylyltransferase/sulfurtransferase
VPQQITVRELARRQAAGEQFLLLDVREQWEHDTASLPGSLLLPLGTLPLEHEGLRPAPGQQLVAYCHHGVRSFNAAAFLEQHGHGPVLSLAGGIDAWSREVDPSVPRY